MQGCIKYLSAHSCFGWGKEKLWNSSLFSIYFKNSLALKAFFCYVDSHKKWTQTFDLEWKHSIAAFQLFAWEYNSTFLWKLNGTTMCSWRIVWKTQSSSGSVPLKNLEVQQHQHQLRAWGKKWRISGPIPNPLHQNLHFNRIP